MKKHIFLLLLVFCAFLVPKNAFAKDINLSSSYGLTLCDEDMYSGNLSNCRYNNTYFISSNATYSMFPAANVSASGGKSWYTSSNAVWLFPSYEFKSGNSYTLKFSFDQGKAISNYLSGSNSSNISFEYQSNGNYFTGGIKNLSYETYFSATGDPYTGYVKFTFEATSNCSGYRIKILPGVDPVLLRNHSDIYAQGFRFVSVYATEDTDPQLPLLGGILSEQQKTNDKLDDLNKSQQEIKDYITDDSEPDSDISSLGNVQGLLPPGPVDSLLNIPLKALSIIVSSLGDNCVPLTGKFVYDSTITIACFSDSFYDHVPDDLMIFINLIPAGFILIYYFKHLYKKVDRAVSMETTADDEWGVL